MKTLTKQENHSTVPETMFAVYETREPQHCHRNHVCCIWNKRTTAMSPKPCLLYMKQGNHSTVTETMFAIYETREPQQCPRNHVCYIWNKRTTAMSPKPCLLYMRQENHSNVSETMFAIYETVTACKTSVNVNSQIRNCDVIFSGQIRNGRPSSSWKFNVWTTYMFQKCINPRCFKRTICCKTLLLPLEF